jgi:hypothetical protein
MWLHPLAIRVTGAGCVCTAAFRAATESSLLLLPDLNGFIPTIRPYPAPRSPAGAALCSPLPVPSLSGHADDFGRRSQVS